jgi:hypothetical protein
MQKKGGRLESLALFSKFLALLVSKAVGLAISEIGAEGGEEFCACLPNWDSAHCADAARYNAGWIVELAADQS